MATEGTTLSDVHAHVHHGDLASDTGNGTYSDPKSARTGATRTRVIQPGPDLRQDGQTNSPKASAGRLEREMQAGFEVAQATAEGSDWAKPAPAPVDVAKRIFPAKGEASSWIAWTAMSIAGIFQLVWVGAGHLIGQAGATRTRAAIATLIVVLAMGAGWLANLT